MKLKNAYFYTLREDVKDEDSISGNLLVKAGYIKKTSAGIYMMLPLGQRVQAKIENIIRKHMDKIDGQELKMPALIAADYYKKSGRLENFGPDLFKLKDRSNKDMVLGPTHEELFVLAAKSMISSYKDLPFNLYQIQNKFRDEPRARYGLIRVKEFTMKDSYTFDLNEEQLDISYQKTFKAYKDIFDELGLNYRIVKADTGVMGGLLSEEFQAISAIGEDILVINDECSYSSNLEIAKRALPIESKEAKLPLKEVLTPNAKTIAEVCAFLNKPANSFVKTLIYQADEKVVAICLPGDREVAESKLNKILHANSLTLATPETVEKVTGAPIGFAGPIGLNITIIVDEEVMTMHNYIVGANQKDKHLLNVNNDDYQASVVADISLVKEGDLCQINNQPLSFVKGIEVGNTFKLGTKYSKALGLVYKDSNNKEHDVWMGCYGIGIGRCIASIVEQYHDDKGIIWPENIAPYKVAICPTNTKDETQMALANKIYESLYTHNVEVILDDRDERAGVKFKDMELIGIPYRITVGRKAVDNIVELKNRKNNDIIELSETDAINYFLH